MEAIFKRFLTQIGDKLPQRVLLPKWLIISLLIAFFSLAVSVGFNIHQRNKFNDMKETAQYWYDTAVEHGYKTKN
jgi:p-aminobenzoyl-glutamate transporter AbgT